MTLKRLTRELLTTLDRNNWRPDSLLLLFPKDRNAAAYLHEAVEVVLVSHNDLRLHKVCHV